MDFYTDLCFVVKAYECSPSRPLITIATCSLIAIALFQLYNVFKLIRYLFILARKEDDDGRRRLEAAYSLPLFEFCNRLALMTEMKLVGQTMERFTNCNYEVFNLGCKRVVIPIPRLLVLCKMFLEDIPQIVC